MDLFTSILNALWVMLDSPLVLVTVVLTFALSLWKAKWWMPALIALSADGAAALLLSKHWHRVGIDFTSQIWQGALLFAAITYSVYAIARLFAYARGRIRERLR